MLRVGRYLSAICPAFVAKRSGSLRFQSHLLPGTKEMEQDWKEEINGGTKNGGVGLANAVVCVFCIQHHFLQLYNTPRCSSTS